MISLNNEPCCVCGNTRSELVSDASYPEHGYPGSFFLRRCVGCGLLFNSPRLDGKELSDLYGKNYYFFNRKDEKEFARIVAMCRRTIGMLDAPPAEKRSIDIGAGRGYFPAVLKELGWDAHGIEISPDAADYGRTKFGYDVFTGTVEQYARSAEAKQYPLVTAIDVIEHVPSPADFVEAIAKITEPGGRVIVDTPHAGAFNITPQGAWWKGFNPFHIFLFTIPNLGRLLENHGFVVEQAFSYGNTRADDVSVPVEDRVYRVAKTVLGPTGLLGPLVGLSHKLHQKTYKNGDPTPLVKSAADQVRAEPSWRTSPDATASLAKNHTGDNIIVIARKA